jgi:glycosyltransferase involved in cell wall biosynthesis
MRIAIGGVRGIPARYGGFETSADETARRIQKLGHQVTVYCRTAKRGQGLSEYDGVQLRQLRSFRSKSLETILHSILVGWDVLRHRHEVDVVHLYNAASAFGGILVRLAGKPLIMTLDGVEWKREKWGPVARAVWKIATWLAVRVAHAAVCDSQTVKDLFEKRYGVKMVYIPYGAKRIEKVSGVYRNFGLEQGKYFIFVGRLVTEKGVDTLLDAYNALKTEIPLVIVGGNELDPDYVASLQRRASAKVHFLGYQYGEEYESLLYNARAYVSASKLEGTSPSLLAAMGANVCCLVSAIEENQETGGDSVLYFDGSAEDLAQKLMVLCEQPDVVEEYGARGYDRVISLYNWDAVTEQYLDAYGEISGGRFSQHSTLPSQS